MSVCVANMDEQIDQFDDGLCTIERIQHASDQPNSDNQTKVNQSSTQQTVSHESMSTRSADRHSDQPQSEQPQSDQPPSDQRQSDQPHSDRNHDASLLNRNPDANRDDNQEDDDQSSTSSSHPPVDKVFKPNYVIAVLPSELEVDECSIYYVIKATKLANNDESKGDPSRAPVNKNEEMIVKREHDDFLYLNHVLVNSAYPGYGLIVPPLIGKPNLDDIYLTTQEVLFNRNALLTNLLYDEQWQKECWFLEQYLHAMLNHSTFGKDTFWSRFLMIR